MRYELNLESQIVQYDGAVQSIADKKAILTQLFSQGVYECTSISNDGCEWTIEYRNTVNNIQKNIVVYYGNIRNEERNDREKKIQLNGKDPRANPNLSIILGVYCYETNDVLENLVFAGWNIDPDTNYPGNPSIRGLNIDSLQKARFNGLYKHNFKNNYVCTFRPEYIFYYIENIQSIHNSSDDVITPTVSTSSQDVNNVIYYGSPGTGKSHRADIETNGKEVQKVTFHPDYDYHSFVGGYKPTMDGDKIAYKFVPQIFTKIYVDAWKNLVSTDETKPFYLQIEEINRGNCAEIFGDLFQLLDRDKDGFSKYEVTAEEELCKYLLSEKGFGGNHPGIENGKLRFPNNLKIIATMNTSDQSLFPMDSAFKRRWDWIYVPIDYNCSSSDFIIKLDNKRGYSWLEFLKIINEEIFEITKSQDKQIGNWFIDAQNSGKVISESTFVNKVIFYLWNDVFKDEENTIFKSADGKNLTYTSFFENGTSNNLVSYILEERLKLIDVNTAEPTTTEEE
ncbi:AAA family ATPase [Flavobacterium sp.]|uniref:AAA family ATPase n=1 Tax=Flavobacterium sp. TaxID=239 RepID=UPI0026195C95|nr:AAA family ATPase [Flavobacterium sp.]MDD2985533.1 AAA family ATPase [Flavobacterium sp.]